MSKFYDEIAKYYDDIFPMQPAKLELIEEQVPSIPSTILDVACATGSYALELEKKGHNLTAIDLDQVMIEHLQERTSTMEVQVMNMLEINQLGTKYDLIYCLGNSIVHLDSLKEVEVFFAQCYKSLKPKGRFLFQIINYDRVLDQKVNGLPTLYNEEKDLAFERQYSYDAERNKIIFRAILSVDGQRVDNSVALLPIRYEDLKAALNRVGFQTITAYGDFAKKPFDPQKSVPCIILAQK